MLRLIFVLAISHAAVSMAWAQSFVEPPVVKVAKEAGYTRYYSYFDDDIVFVETRVYDRPTDAGHVILNTIHTRNEEKGYGALIYEYIHADKYVRSLNFNRSQVYTITMDKFPNGKEAILVFRKKDYRKPIAVIGKKESGAWDTENNEELNALVRKYHPELKP
jgi:hypothetical protein